MAFLSLNRDDNPGLMGPIMAEHNLTVLPADSYASDTIKIDVIRQNWIVGPDSIILLKAIGSYDALEKWDGSHVTYCSFVSLDPAERTDQQSSGTNLAQN